MACCQKHLAFFSLMKSLITSSNIHNAVERESDRQEVPSSSKAPPVSAFGDERM